MFLTRKFFSHSAAALVTASLSASILASAADAAPRHKRHHHRHHVRVVQYVSPVIATTDQWTIDRDPNLRLNQCTGGGNCSLVLASTDRLACAVGATSGQGRYVSFEEKLRTYRSAIAAGCGNAVAIVTKY